MQRVHGMRSYEPYAVEGDRAVAVGRSDYYENGKLRTIFYNVWLLRFDDDRRCADFVEYWREHPKEQLPVSAARRLLSVAGGSAASPEIHMRR